MRRIHPPYDQIPATHLTPQLKHTRYVYLLWGLAETSMILYNTWIMKAEDETRNT